ALRALDEHRLLCAHRSGPYGAATWNRQIERWLGEAIGQGLGSGWGREWYAGRPVMVSANDYGLGLYNGDTGITVRRGDGLRVAIAAADGIVEYAPSRLVDVETMHAMTVHKSQGSEARAVTVLLPPEDSRLATRELFYTAITRAQESLRVVGSEAALRAAIGRRAQRASGLRQRLAT
ncbi:MAG: ATP-binding domain-containing protein, partial [Nocardioides sp.]